MSFNELIIVDDTNLSLFYNEDCAISIYINDVYCQPLFISESRAVYKIEKSLDYCKIKLSKEDIWKHDDRTDRVFLGMFSTDIVWGNSLETANLPFYIDSLIDLSQKEIMTYTINLSSLIKVEDKSLASWKKFSNIQIFILSIVIFIIGLILSAVINKAFILFIFSFAVTSVCLTYVLTKRRNKVFKMLAQFLI